MDNLPEYKARMLNIFKRGAIPVKDIVLTHTTVIVKMFGEKHTDKVAGILRAAGYKHVKILDDRPTIFTTPPAGEWSVCARTFD